MICLKLLSELGDADEKNSPKHGQDTNLLHYKCESRSLLLQQIPSNSESPHPLGRRNRLKFQPNSFDGPYFRPFFHVSHVC